MQQRFSISLRLALAFAILTMLGTTSLAQHEHGGSLIERKPDSLRSTIHQEGLHVNPVPSYAIVGAAVHRNPNAEPKIETIVIERGKIIGLGVEVKIPTGAKRIDLTGKHIYAGLIDGYSDIELEFASEKGTSYWNDNIRPQLKLSQQFESSNVDQSSMRKAGFTAALMAPSGGIIKGQSSVLMLGDQASEHALLTENIAQHLKLTVDRRSRSGYPNSPMGAYALARQSLIDANWYREAWATANANAATPTPETNHALAALQPVVSGDQLVMIDSSNELFTLRADRFAREFGLKAIVLGSGNEYRRLDEIASTGRSIIVPVNFPKAPDVSSPELARDVNLETMMHWDHAPENPARLSAHDVDFVFTSLGLKDKSSFLKNVRVAVKRGLDKEIALDAMTLGVAKLYGIDHLVGSVAKNKTANLTIVDGDLFDDETKVVGVCIDGKMFVDDHPALRKIAGNWTIKAGPFDGLTLNIKDKKGTLSADIEDPEKVIDEDSDQKSKDAAPGEDEEATEDEPKSTKTKIKSLKLDGTRLTGTFDSSDFEKPGVSMFTILFANEESGIGQLTLPDGSLSPFSVTPSDEWDKTVNGHKHVKKDDSTEEKTDQEESTESEADPAKDEKSDKVVMLKTDRGHSFPVNYPLGAFGRESAPEAPATVLIKNVTIWTLDKNGKIEDGAILFGKGKVLQVFKSGEQLPKADKTIDGKGGHVTPGIIDCHSHMASDSGINESGQAITAEVRIGDMIDCDDVTIYRQLAGGVTTSNILHGSANPIGGQNQVIKLRWGANEEQMKFKDAPKGIKFALGENVKQSNWSNPTNRYPQTRMGVEQLIDDALRAAKDYQQQWKAWEQTRSGLPPRRDLELEALAEIVAGQRWIHCHSYRQDEILALIRTLDQHEITIGSFQHILEGYKVADAMAKHGATGSAFADWWAYKYEVKDAIPYAGALMHRAGVVVSFNSDDGELGRRLNQEAAKAVRYGGVSEVEALKFVTLNPAIQLRIDDRVGSLEKGKDADLVLWTGHPLSNMSTVQQTWVDGRKYFDRQDDRKLQEKQQRMRVSLIQKILDSGEKMERPDRSKVDPAKLWPRFDEFCGHQHHDDHVHQYEGGEE
ncbi:MAG: amidohydrolase family protein [Planctomycetota bacterium]